MQTEMEEVHTHEVTYFVLQEPRESWCDADVMILKLKNCFDNGHNTL
jgi:hypothetical protein